MQIFEVTERPVLLIQQLLQVWESAVKKTHLFLSDSEIEEIKKYVPQALEHISHLIIAENEHKIPIAFMGFIGRYRKRIGEAIIAIRDKALFN